jgi:hypothetical protein
MSDEEPVFRREPDNDVERLAVKGFEQVSDIVELWVRDRPPQLDDAGMMVTRVYLAFKEFDSAAREMADRIEEELRMRTHYKQFDESGNTIWRLDLYHMRLGARPSDGAVLIWQRHGVFLPSDGDVQKYGAN